MASQGKHLQLKLQNYAILILYAIPLLFFYYAIFAYQYPLDTDYLNHLSRMYAGDAPVGSLAQETFYLNNKPTTNLLIDIVWLIGRNLSASPELILNFYMMLSATVFWFAALYFYKQCHQTIGISLALIAPTILSLYSYGLYSFCLGLGLVLLIYGSTLLDKIHGIRRLLVVNLLGTILILVHLGAFAIFTVLYAAKCFDKNKNHIHVLANVLLALIGPAIVYVLSAKTNVDYIFFASVGRKLISVLLLIGDNGSQLFSLIWGLVLLLTLACLKFAKSFTITGVHKRVLIALIILGILAPYSLNTSHYVDIRLFWFAILYFLLTAKFEAQSPLRDAILCGIVGAILAVMISNKISMLRIYNEDVVEVRSAVQSINEQSHVYVSSTSSGCLYPVENRYYDHIASLVTIDRDSIQPYIFAHSGNFMLNFRPSQSSYFAPYPMSPTDTDLSATMIHTDLSAFAPTDYISNDYHKLPIYPYMVGWFERYDYVIHLKQGCDEPIAYDGVNSLHKIAEGRYFVIYKINNPKNKAS